MSELRAAAVRERGPIADLAGQLLELSSHVEQEADQVHSRIMGAQPDEPEEAGHDESCLLGQLHLVVRRLQRTGQRVTSLNNALLVLLAILLVGCAPSRGAGNTQDPCGLAQVQKALPTELAQQQQQLLRTGQEVSNQPTMTDNVPMKPGTTWNGGAGALDSENTWVDERSLSGAPSVAQGLLFPATQNQSQEAGLCSANGISPVIATLQGVIHDTQKRLDVAVATGNLDLAQQLRLDLDLYTSRLAQASADTAKTVNIHYDFNGAYITQGVSSSSTASGKPGSASTTEEGTAATMTAEEIARESGAVPVEPELLPDPPAGVVVPE